MVEQHELRVHVVTNVPNAVEQFNKQVTVFIRCDVDGVKHAHGVFEGDGSIGHIEERLLRLRVHRRHQGHGDVDGIRHVQSKGDVGGVVVHEGGLVEVVPSVVVNVASVVVVSFRHRPVGEISVLIGHDGDRCIYTEVNIDQFDGLVGQNITVHVQQGILEDGTWHVHGEVIRGLNTDFNRVRQEHFLTVGQLSDHVVGSRQQASLVERTWLNHWPRERTDTDEQTCSVECTGSFERTCAFDGLALSCFCITVRTAQRGDALRGERTKGRDRTFQAVGRRRGCAVRKTERFIDWHHDIGIVVSFTVDHVVGINP